MNNFLRPLNSFLKNEKATGILLFLSAAVAMIWANIPFKHTYFGLWESHLTVQIGIFKVSKTLQEWINDGLMSVFFFVVGLELKRELIGGELSTFRKAILPIGAAVGGMVIPAVIYLLFNHKTETARGWGIPMATDIAFSLGILYLLGNRIPQSVKLFLTALAITDDLGAVLAIAFFYTSDISFINLAIGAGFLLTLIAGNFFGVRNPIFYAVLGIGGMWLAFLLSGVHATIAGVLAALVIPATTTIDKESFVQTLRKYTERFQMAPDTKSSLVSPEQLHIINSIKISSARADTPLQRIEHAFQPVVSFVVLPLFALANAGVDLTDGVVSSLVNSVTIGIAVGLIIGKFIGVAGFSLILMKLKLAKLPKNMNRKHLIGLSLLAGMGFTMSLFISILAFNDQAVLFNAKVGILLASLISAIAGYIVLFRMSKSGKKQF